MMTWFRTKLIIYPSLIYHNLKHHLLSESHHFRSNTTPLSDSLPHTCQLLYSESEDTVDVCAGWNFYWETGQALGILVKSK